MKKIIFLSVFVFLFSTAAHSYQINVCLKVRGNTGIETEIKEIYSKQINSLENVKLVEDKNKCHLYLDLALVVQEPIDFYAMGISIAYHIKGEFYSRPTSDVAQFGIGKSEEISKFLITEIDKAFLDPLRNKYSKEEGSKKTLKGYQSY